MKSDRLYGYFWSNGRRTRNGRHVFKVRSHAVAANVCDLLAAELIPFEQTYNNWTKKYSIYISEVPDYKSEEYLGIGFITSIIEMEGDGDGMIMEDTNLAKIKAVQEKCEMLNLKTTIWSGAFYHKLYLDIEDWPKLKKFPFVSRGNCPF